MIAWALRFAVLWTLMGVVAAGVYTCRGAIAPSEKVFLDHRSPASDRRTPADSRSMTIRAGPQGHFLIDASVEGTPVQFLVDTGASTVVLRRQDADRIGLKLHARDFTQRLQTANGLVRAAPVVLREVRAASLSVRQVQASVNDGPLEISLLGMSFLNRLDGYEVKGNRLILYW